MSNLIYASPDDIRPNRDRVDMKSIDLMDFLDWYAPVCNDKIPFKHSTLTPMIGKIIWDKRDFSLLANYLGEKRLWTVNDIGNGKFTLVPGVRIRNQEDLIGFIVTEVEYNRNDIGNLKVLIDVNNV